MQQNDGGVPVPTSVWATISKLLEELKLVADQLAYAQRRDKTIDWPPRIG